MTDKILKYLVDGGKFFFQIIYVKIQVSLWSYLSNHGGKIIRVKNSIMILEYYNIWIQDQFKNILSKLNSIKGIIYYKTIKINN